MKGGPKEVADWRRAHKKDKPRWVGGKQSAGLGWYVCAIHSLVVQFGEEANGVGDLNRWQTEEEHTRRTNQGGMEGIKKAGLAWYVWAIIHSLVVQFVEEVNGVGDLNRWQTEVSVLAMRKVHKKDKLRWVGGNQESWLRLVCVSSTLSCCAIWGEGEGGPQQVTDWRRAHKKDKQG